MENASKAHTQFLEIGSELSDAEFVSAFAFAARARKAGTSAALRHQANAGDARPADDADMLDAAASVAASHRSLSDHEEYLRSLLALVAAQNDLARELGGDPRQVLSDIEQSVLRRATILGEAVRAIWRQPMLQPGDAARALGAEPSNRERVRQLRLRSELLGLPHGRGYLYPAFQFDHERRCVDAAVSAVNKRLDACNDPWGVASWWFSRNARVEARPADLVGTGRDDDLVGISDAVVELVG